jgi:hypothetical protein
VTIDTIEVHLTKDTGESRRLAGFRLGAQKPNIS